MHHFMLPKLRLIFSQRTCPIHFFRPKSKFLGGFVRFRSREVQVVRSGFGVHKMHHFVVPKLCLVFRNEHAKSTSLGPKQCFWVVSRDSIAWRYKLLYRVLGCIQCTALCFRSCVVFFRNEHAQSTSLGPKQCFWVVSRDSVDGRYKLLYRDLGCIKCKTMFLDGFARFRYREVPVVRSGFGVHTMHRFMLPKLRLVFSQRTCPIHFFRPKTKFLGGFSRFRCRVVQVVRSGFGVHKMHHFVLSKLRLVFLLRSCPIHFFRPGWFRAIPLPGGTRCENG